MHISHRKWPTSTWLARNNYSKTS